MHTAGAYLEQVLRRRDGALPAAAQHLGFVGRGAHACHPNVVGPRLHGWRESEGGSDRR